MCAAARWQKPNPNNPSELLGSAVLSNGGYRQDRDWVFWTFLIEVGYLVVLIVCTAVALKILNRERQPFQVFLGMCGGILLSRGRQTKTSKRLDS